MAAERAAPSRRGILELLCRGKDLDEVTTSVV